MSTGSCRWRRARLLGAFMALVVLALCLPSIAHAAGLMPVYRFYNVKTGMHFYTASETEKADVVARLSSVYRFEGVAYTINTDDAKNSTPLYRFFNMKNGVHFYTASATEKDRVIATMSGTLRFEGTAYLVSLDPVDTSPVWRFYNAKKGAHFYTASAAEKDNVIAKLSSTFKYEGVSFYFAGVGGTSPDMPVHQHNSTQAFCTQVGCHFVSLTVEHYRWPTTGTKFDCFTCHKSTNPDVVDTITAKSDTCTDCHTAVAAHPGTSLVHNLPTLLCTSSGCHSGPGANLATIHNNKCGSPGLCHANGVVPTNDCQTSTCHGANGPHSATHEVIASSGKPTCTTTVCHGGDAMAIHTGGCAQCHSSTRTGVPEAIAAGLAGTPASCESCHDAYDVIHVVPAGAHTLTGSCYTSNCHHYTDISLIHTVGDDPPGCWTCHAVPGNAAGPGVVKSKNCVTCHPNLLDFHSFTHVDAVGSAPEFKSRPCTACHGTDLPTVHTKLGCFCHTSSLGFSMAGEMGPLLEKGSGECVDCHKDKYAAHGFSGNVSGHNTTTFGTVGARTDFSSLGVTDTAGNAPAAQFPQTVNNTFKAGYDWNTVVKCEDCHAGLTAYEVAGPHGGSVIAAAGIDPAYPGSFESASLWGGQYAVKLADGTTMTVGPFAEGVAQWANTSGDPEGLAGYQVATPDMSTAASTKLVAGPASVTAGNVICVKCHDLYDGTKTTGFKGWANYAHEHHSADTGSFKMIFGKFEVGDGGVAVTSQTVAAESAAAAMAMVPGATKNKQIIAPSLGREDAGACRNCHIAIPHGWKRPKLIVYSNLNANDPGRAALGMPATGDSAPYNIGPAVYEGESLFGTGLGSGQMNGLASGLVTFKEAWTLLDGSTVVTSGSDPAQLLIETENMPALIEAHNPADGSEYVNWSSAQCNACGHHSSTSFANPTATQPALTWNSRESNWTSTKPANGAWK